MFVPVCFVSPASAYCRSKKVPRTVNEMIRCWYGDIVGISLLTLSSLAGMRDKLVVELSIQLAEFLEVSSKMIRHFVEFHNFFQDGQKQIPTLWATNWGWSWQLMAAKA